MKPVVLGLGAAALLLLVAGTSSASSSGGRSVTPLPQSKKRRWPVSTYRGILSGFGARRPPTPKNPMERRHAGVDLTSKVGDDIVALDEGVVLYPVSGYEIGNKLQAVAVRHPDADYIYGEIKVAVAPGQKLAPGDVIGHAGLNNVGNSMLHLEAWETGKAPKSFTRWVTGQPMPDGLLDVEQKVRAIDTKSA